MANWKKMAEAFGRAMSGVNTPADAKTSAQKMVRDVHRASTDRNVERKIANDAWGGPNDPGIDEYRKGQDDLPWQPEFDRTKDYDPSSEHREAIIDAMTDRDLQNDFDKEFRNAIERRKQGVRDSYGKDYPKDMADKGADTFEDDLWNVINGLRDKGMSGTDILNMLKGK